MPGATRTTILALVAAGLLWTSAAAGAGAPLTLIGGRALTASPSGVVHAGRVAISLTLPEPGSVTLTVVHHGHPIGRRRVTLATGGPRIVGVPLVAAALRELSQGNFSAGLRVAFVSRRGERATSRFGLRVKRAPTVASSAGASPAWLAPVSLSAAGSSSRPSVALDPAGDAVVVFEHFRGGRTTAPRATVQAVVRPAGGAFSVPLDVSLPSDDIALFPDVAIDQAGDAIAVWQRSDGDSIIQAAVRPAGGHFSAPVDLSAPGHDSRAAHVVINAAGDAIVVWAAYAPNGESQSVEAVVRPAHGGFSVPVRLSAPGGALYGEDAALDANGDALVVWGRAPERHGFSQGNETIIQASTRPAGGPFSTPVDLTARSRSTIDGGPVVALAPAGEAIVAWDHRTGYFAQTIQAAVRPAGGSFSAPVVLSGPREQSFDPAVAFDAAGDAFALWGHADRLRRTRVNMQASLRPAGGGFSRPLDLSGLARDPRLSFTDTDPATRLAVDAAGDAVAISKRYERRGEAVIGAVRRAGQPFAAPQRLSRLGRDDTLDPDLGIDGVGNAVAVWERDRGHGIGTVQASELRSPGGA